MCALNLIKCLPSFCLRKLGILRKLLLWSLQGNRLNGMSESREKATKFDVHNVRLAEEHYSAREAVYSETYPPDTKTLKEPPSLSLAALAVLLNPIFINQIIC